MCWAVSKFKLVVLLFSASNVIISLEGLEFSLGYLYTPYTRLIHELVQFYIPLVKSEIVVASLFVQLGSARLSARCTATYDLPFDHYGFSGPVVPIDFVFFASFIINSLNMCKGRERDKTTFFFCNF